MPFDICVLTLYISVIILDFRGYSYYSVHLTEGLPSFFGHIRSYHHSSTGAWSYKTLWPCMKERNNRTEDTTPTSTVLLTIVKITLGLSRALKQSQRKHRDS